MKKKPRSKASRVSAGEASSVAKRPLNAQPGDLLSNIRMERLVLNSLSCSRIWGTKAGRLIPNLTYGPKVVEVIEDKGLIHCLFALKFESLLESTREVVSKIELEYLLGYACPGISKSDSKFLDRFSTVNVPYHVWPFIREKVLLLTREMELPEFFLPPYVIASAKEPLVGGKRVNVGNKPKQVDKP